MDFLGAVMLREMERGFFFGGGMRVRRKGGGVGMARWDGGGKAEY